MENDVLEINKDVVCKLKELNKDRVYIFNIEIGDMTRDDTIRLLNFFKGKVEELGIVGLYVPTHNGIGSVSVQELCKYEEK